MFNYQYRYKVHIENSLIHVEMYFIVLKNRPPDINHDMVLIFT